MANTAPPSHARFSRRGRARLKREEQPAALTLVAEREQDAIDPPFDPPDVDDVMGEYEAETYDEAGTLLLNDLAREPLPDAPESQADPAESLPAEALEPFVEAPMLCEAEPTSRHAELSDEEELTLLPPPPAQRLELTQAVAEEPLVLTQPIKVEEKPDDTAALRSFAPSAMRAAEPSEPGSPQTERRGQYQPPPNSALKYTPRKDELNEVPVPPITIHISWERPEVVEQQLQYFVADKHLARAEITMERGGLDGAIAHCATQSPDLLIIDTTLYTGAMLEGLDRLARIIAPNSKLIIIGAINDVSLLRELAARGVAEYIVPPARRNDLIRAACRLFADADTARVFAVIGARGGVGASTLAQNLAWTLAARQDARTALVDLDLPFGSAAFALGDHALGGTQPIRADSDFLRATAARAERLEIVTVSNAFRRDVRCDQDKLDALLQSVRRQNSFVVLDLPHDWNSWVKRALAGADATLIVASPDLASLRNTEGMIRQLKAMRAQSAPMVALSMVGMRERCEIPRKDFLNAVSAEAVLELPFDPALFGLAALKGQMLSEIAPKVKATLDIEAFATSLTGRECVTRKAKPKAEALLKPKRAESVSPPPAKPEAPSKEAEAEALRPPKQRGPSKPSKARRKSLKAVTTEPDLITYPLTFLKAGEAQTPKLANLEPAASAPDVSLVAALRAQTLMAAPSPTRRALRIAAMTALLLQASSWALQAQPGGQADAAQITPSAPITAPAPASMPMPDPLAALRSEAESGAALAQFELAQRLRSGEGASADPAAALAWFERAAAGGHCQAMYELGVAYAQADGVARDDAAAFRWFRQAAEYDVADAQYNLALLYQQGVGVSASMPEALFWFLRAAQSGDGPAAERASMLASFLPAAEIEQARARVHAFQPQASALPVQCAPAQDDN